MTSNTSFNTSAAADTQVVIELNHLTAAVTAYLYRTDGYALMAVGAVFLSDSNYFN
jgi:hypothetical protein